MTGLKQRILGRRSAAPPVPAGPPAAGAPEPSAPPNADRSTVSAPGALPVSPDDAPTAALAPAADPVAAAADRASALPAGTDPATIDRPGFRERGRMRRRLRYLRSAREFALRDLGGLVFDLRRFRRQRFDLVEAKLQALTLVDRELRTLEAALNDHRPIAELRQAGITSCPRCDALTASDANFCAHCGLQLGATPAAAVAAPPIAGSAPPAGAEPLTGAAPALTAPTTADGARGPQQTPPAPSGPWTSGDPLA